MKIPIKFTEMTGKIKLLFTLFSIAGGLAATAEPIEVQNLSESGPGSLRQAIMDATPTDGVRKVVFHESLSGGEIQLAQQLVSFGEGAILIDASMLAEKIRITAPTANTLLLGFPFAEFRNLEFAENNAILFVDSGDVKFKDCDFRSNEAIQENGSVFGMFSGNIAFEGCLFAANGNLIYVDGSSLRIEGCAFVANGNLIFCNFSHLTIKDSSFKNNSPSFSLIGVFGSHFSLSKRKNVIERCRFSGNTSVSGPGCMNIDNSFIDIFDSEFSSNQGSTAGAIFLETTEMTVERCSFIGNQSLIDGGAITMFAATVDVKRSTFAGNVANGMLEDAPSRFGYGGAIHCVGRLVLNHVMIADNYAPTQGGGVYLGGGSLEISNSICARNSSDTGAADIHVAKNWMTDQFSGTIVRKDANIVGDNNGIEAFFPAGSPNIAGDYVGGGEVTVEVGLGEINDYGGFTKTVPLLTSSLARDRAIVTENTGDADQRGFPLVGLPDIGAYEAGHFGHFNAWSVEALGKVVDFSGDETGNGIMDGLEYATRFGEDGNLLTFFLEPERVGASGVGESWSMRFAFREEAADIRYIVQRSRDLGASSSWEDILIFRSTEPVFQVEGVEHEVDLINGTISLNDSSVGDSWFWRLMVEIIE